MAKIISFILGACAGLYLCNLSSAEKIICGIFAVILVLLFVIGYVFHLGVSDFQEFEG
ncbi:MAG: hypothetical protein JNM55_21115 [Anaerolineales bacterium]|nr:hypothetical protein [Anaerolineales bacterium]